MKNTNTTMQALWSEFSEGWANYKSWKIDVPFTKKNQPKILLSVAEQQTYKLQYSTHLQVTGHEQ